MPVAVVATGHEAVAAGDGAVLINLRRMDSIVIDQEQRTATVGAAVQMQHLIYEAAEKRLAPLAGSSPNVGVVGYTLGGGVSPTLGRAYGYAADHVRAAEIVNTDGQLRHIDQETEPDLFWAIRGGKGNFGVVTSLTLDLVPVTRLRGRAVLRRGARGRGARRITGSWSPMRRRSLPPPSRSCGCQLCHLSLNRCGTVSPSTCASLT